MSPDDSHEPDCGPLRGLGRRLLTPRVLTIALSVFAGLLVFLVASELFPYHANNHDEAVYLQQAALLLDGKLWFTTAHSEAFRPWFFVRDGLRMYPKYSPMVAALFAPAVAIGVPRLSLALVAAGNAALVAALTREAFDSRTGVLAVLFLVASPLFVLTSSVFLPYAPTALLNLTFALCYVRAIRRRRLEYAVCAGIVIGLAFFARPYTALLFAAPFTLHACLTLARALRSGERTRRRVVAYRYVAIAVPGLVFVGVTLAYNRVVTGSFLLFPYEAFAPLDGLGFGRRRLLNYEVNYTPALALQTNARVLFEFATRWTAAGPVGTALVGVAITVTLARAVASQVHKRRRGDRPDGIETEQLGDESNALADERVRWLLLGVLVSVALGNVYFWGNLNVLGTIFDPTDGMISRFGPYYHFDMLGPLSVFGAAGTLWLADRVNEAASARFSRRGVRTVALVALLVSAPTAALAERNAVGPPLAENAAFTERYETAYAPFETGDGPENALVFVPTPYGAWLAHPLQRLRNGPSLDGERIYALNRGSENLALLRDYPNRTPYRYTYRGKWDADPAGDVTPRIQRLHQRTGARYRITTTVGVPERMESASVRIESDGGAIQYVVSRSLDDHLVIEWMLTPDGVRARGDRLRRLGDSRTIPLAGELAFTVTFVGQDGASVTYRQDLATVVENGRVRLLWPPENKVCRLATDCGHEGTYLPDTDEHLPGVSVESTIETANAS